MYCSVELGYKPFGTEITQLITNNLAVEKSWKWNTILTSGAHISQQVQRDWFGEFQKNFNIQSFVSIWVMKYCWCYNHREENPFSLSQLRNLGSGPQWCPMARRSTELQKYHHSFTPYSKNALVAYFISHLNYWSTCAVGQAGLLCDLPSGGLGRGMSNVLL